MAALVKVAWSTPRANVGGEGMLVAGPIKVAEASETDLSTPDTSITLDTKGVSLMILQLVSANYTSVTVKAQKSLDGTTWVDITGASLSASGIFAIDPQSPQVRLSLAGTLSGSADTMGVWVYMEYMR